MMVCKGSFCFLKQVWWRILTFKNVACSGQLAFLVHRSLWWEVLRYHQRCQMLPDSPCSCWWEVLRCIAAVFAKQRPHGALQSSEVVSFDSWVSLHRHPAIQITRRTGLSPHFTRLAQQKGNGCIKRSRKLRGVPHIESDWIYLG